MLNVSTLFHSIFAHERGRIAAAPTDNTLEGWGLLAVAGKGLRLLVFPTTQHAGTPTTDEI